jgi:hypothetical protein
MLRCAAGLPDPNGSKELYAQKNNQMTEAVEINFKCFHCFFLLLGLGNPSSYFETSESVNPVAQRNFPEYHNPHYMLFFTCKVK